MRGADPLDLAGFEDAEEFRLLVHREIGDLVEKQRAPIGQLETADAIGFGVRERAPDVAEELAFENAFRAGRRC